MEHESNDFRHVLEFMEVNPQDLIKVPGSLNRYFFNGLGYLIGGQLEFRQ